MRSGFAGVAALLALVAATTGCRRRTQEKVTELALDETEACARVTSGKVLCWGDRGEAIAASPRRREDLELGDAGAALPGRGPSRCAIARVMPDAPGGQVVCEGAPVALPGPASAVTAGAEHVCALLEKDGSAWCWGDNASGQLGDGTTERRASPARVDGIVGAAQIVAGRAHTCARHRSGTVACWGDNAARQLADGTDLPRSRPTTVVGMLGVVQLVAAGDSTCARRGDGEVRCWGSNEHGRLVWSMNDAPLNVPTPIGPLRVVEEPRRD